MNEASALHGNSTIKVALIWEHGGGLGHDAALGPVAHRLIERGAEVCAWVGNTSKAKPWYPASVDLREVPPVELKPVRSVPATYADVLAHSGWSEPRHLKRVVKKWRRLLRRFAPDVVVLNSAPNALLALHGMGIPTVGYGAPWFTPPSTGALPSLQWWKPPVLGATQREQAVLEVANAARAPDSPVLECLGSLWRGATTIVQGPPELDPWRDLRGPDVVHAGVTAVLDQGSAQTWPDGDGPKVFVYLKPSYERTPRVLGALEALGCRTLGYIPGKRVDRVQTKIYSTPIQLSRVRETADLVVTHSALTTGCAFLSAGVPGLFLPMHLEQLSSGRCASMRLEGAATVPMTAVDAQLVRALRLVLDPSIREAARQQALDWRVPQDPAGRVADLVMAACR